MMEFPSILNSRLEEFSQRGKLRRLQNRHGIDLTSNDYLGFTSDPVLRERFSKAVQNSIIPLGASGSRLLRGQIEVFEKIEERLAKFSGKEASLLFSTGYQANLGLYSALLTQNDLVFSDEYNHASIIDGIKLSRSLCIVYPHNDIVALRELLEKNKNHIGLKVIATESIFSMEGDEARLEEIISLATEYSCLVVVDEAHATGIFGSGLVQSRGLQDKVFATVHTAGKALGASGAWIASDYKFKEFLINFSRPFIYSTAPLPLLAVILENSLNYFEEVGKERAKAVLSLSSYFILKIEAQQSRYNFSIPDVKSCIVPLIIGGTARTLAIAEELQKKNYDVRAIRPPTVPEGTSRLRIVLNSKLTAGHIDTFVSDLFSAFEKSP